MKVKNKKRKIAKEKVFEEYYFKGYYSGIGDFSTESDRRLANWFYGMFDYIKKHYPIDRGNKKRLIEFGCATGIASKILTDYGYKVTATDISAYAVKRAKKNYPFIDFKVHDMHEPVLGKKYDLSIAFDVIEHLEDPKRGIKNVYNLLGKGGTAIFSTPNDYEHISNDPTHISVKTPEEWKKIIKEVGFKKIWMKQIVFLPFFYRFSRMFNIALPFAVNSKYVISPVMIIAKK